MSCSYLSSIDTNEKAYCLGFFSYINDTHSRYSENTYEFSNIYLDEDKKTIETIKNIVDIFYDEKKEVLSMTIIDDKILDDINNHLKTFDINDSKWNPKLIKEFIRGLYEYNYLYIKDNDDNNNCDDYDSNSNSNKENILIRKNKVLNNVLQQIGDYLNIPYIFMKGTALTELNNLPDVYDNEEINKDELEFLYYSYGCSKYDFLGAIYKGVKNCSFVSANFNLTIPQCNFIRVSNEAIAPSKENWSDVGYDLSIISKIKDFNSRTSLYDTGIKIDIDFGYYAEIVPRSSISKYGYIMSNNIGIIDNSYRGNLMIALTKIADDAIEIEYPFRCCQLIIKKQDYVNLEEVESGLSETKRNEGGFGSTGK
jgi:dUTP pyrophosphatase